MTTKRKIVWIPSLYSDKLVHLSYNNKNYVIRDFVNPQRSGKIVEILPLIEKGIEAKGQISVPVSDVNFWREKLKIISEKFFLGNNINIENCEPINSSSKSIAEKHTSISCQIEDIFKEIHPEYQTYITVYRALEYYSIAEEKTKRTFYHLKMYDKNDNIIKDPDIIIVKKDVIKYAIEVKWGFVEDYPSVQTDLKSIFNTKELKEIIDMIKNAGYRKIKGPYVQNGIRVQGNESSRFKIDGNTKFVIVTDLKGLHDSNSSTFETIKQKYKINYKDNNISIDICDITENVDIFQSFKNYLKDTTRRNII
jgi:hypothetical protein